MDTQQQDVSEVESRVLAARAEQQAEQYKARRAQQYAEFDYLGDWLTGDQELTMQVAREDAINHLVEGTQLIVPNAAWMVGLIDYANSLKVATNAVVDQDPQELVSSIIKVLGTLTMKDTKKDMLDRIAKVTEILEGVIKRD